MTYPTLHSSIALPTILPMAPTTAGSTCAVEYSGAVWPYHKFIRNIEGIKGLDDEHPASNRAVNMKIYVSAERPSISQKNMPVLL